VAHVGEMQRGRPAAVAVTPEYQNLHRSRLLLLYVCFLFRIKPNLNRTHWPPIVAEKRRNDRRTP
jgi:hypothetical protein